MLRFRCLLETHQLTRVLFETVSQHLANQGPLLKEGTIVDATLIAASPSIKNREGEHDPEMHLSKKGNQWHFGINVHIGVHATSGLVHSVVVTAANVADVTQVAQLLDGEENAVYAGVAGDCYHYRDRYLHLAQPVNTALKATLSSAYAVQVILNNPPPL